VNRSSKKEWEDAIQAERENLPETLRLFGDTLNVFCRAGSDVNAKFQFAVPWLYALWEAASKNQK
jgi:hypothetical protein